MNAMTSTKTLPPIYARPGRLECLKQSIALAGEVAATLKAANADERLIDVVDGRRASLHAEVARTIEAPVPRWYRHQHASELTQFNKLVSGSLPGARNALAQFLDRRDYNQASKYAAALINLPNEIWQDTYGGR